MGEKRSIPAVCAYCGCDFLTYKTSLKNGNGKYCGHPCANKAKGFGKISSPDKHPNWKGGRYISRFGYVLSLVPGSKNRYALDHRVVMEKFIGRSLRRDEVIHHISGDKTDNRIENLQIIHPNEHSQLHADILKAGLWAIGHPCCIECKTTERKHAGHGLCRNCFMRSRRRNAHEKS